MIEGLLAGLGIGAVIALMGFIILWGRDDNDGPPDGGCAA